jgi:hypothetical protein
VLENLLGMPPPPPPADVPVLDESKIGTTVSLRERLEQHRADPNCSGCHSLMDPIGAALATASAANADGMSGSPDHDDEVRQQLRCRAGAQHPPR